MRALQPVAFLMYMAALLVWNIFLAGRIGRRHELPRLFTGLSGLSGFLLPPALLIFIAGSALLTGRAIHSVTWIWPVACVLVALQSAYSLIARRLPVVAGLPLLLYNVLATLLAVAGWMLLRGMEPPDGLLALSAANAIVLAAAAGPGALHSAFFVVIPLVAPAYPLRPRTLRAWRVATVVVALGWTGFVLVRMPAGRAAIASYEELDPDDQPPHIGEPVSLGLKIFPDLSSAPPPVARRADMQLAGEIRARVLAVTIVPGIRAAALDSIRRTLEPARADTATIVVTLATPSAWIPLTPSRRLAAMNRRAAAAEEIARRIRPDYMILAVDPFGPGGGALAWSSVERWQRHLEDAAASARRGHSAVRTGVTVNPAGARDSSLHAWAASDESTLRVAGFSLAADARGGAGLLERMDRADAWIAAAGNRKEYWVLPVAGLPLAHGARSQDRAITAILGWAVEKSSLRGAVVWESREYGSRRGLVPPLAREGSALDRLTRLLDLAREASEQVPAFAPPPR